MSKTVMFKFRDGVKPVSVGMKVYMDNGQGGSHFHAYETEITDIGRKYITVQGSVRFDIETGKHKTDYVGNNLWSSEEAFTKIKSESKKIHAVWLAVKEYNSIKTVEQAIEIARVLNIDLKDVT